MDDDLLERLRRGEPAAAAEIHGRFAARLVALARSRLNPRLLQKVDPEDIVQSVFSSFFTREALGAFEFKDNDGLWSLLATITVRKCGRKAEQFKSARRCVDSEVPLAQDRQAYSGWQAMATDPTPSQAAMLTETVEIVMRRLDQRQREILGLALQGVPHDEIAGKMECSDRTVQRALEKTRFVLEELQDGEN